MQESWLSIAEASRMLGVHPGTLRRWADAEQIPFTRTPGGHRRFALTALQAFQDRQGRLKYTGGLEQRWSDVARRGTRRELRSRPGWGKGLSDAARAQFRRLGRELLELTTAEISAGERPSTINAASQIGGQYARLGKQHGLTLAELTQAIQLADASLTEAALELPEVEQLQRSAVLSVMQAISRIMGAVQLALVVEYTKDATVPDRSVKQSRRGDVHDG